MERAFGLDISKYQSSADGTRKMDFNKVANNKEPVTFIAARAGVSWGYQDPRFDYYWSEMARIKVGRIAYHVLYFGESALAQMDALFKILENKADWNYDRLALDAEVNGINTRARITATTLKCLDICRARTGRYPIVYSRASWVNTYMDVSSLPTVDWWLANYRKPAPPPFYTAEHPGPPLLPKGVSTYLIHQTGDRCKPIGAYSSTMDYNRWNGDKAAVARYFGNQAGQVLPPAPAVLFQAKCIVPALYKRQGPGTSYKVIGALSLGDVVNVYEQSGDWFRIDSIAQVWCCGASNYMQRIAGKTAAALFKAQCVVPAQYLRSGPAKTHAVIGTLQGGQVVNVYQVQNDWLRVSADQQVWACGTSQYMRRL